MNRVGRISSDKSMVHWRHHCAQKCTHTATLMENNGGYYGTVTSVSEDIHKITCGLKISQISSEGVITAKTLFGPQLTCK